MRKITKLFSLLVFLLMSWTNVLAQSIFVQEKALRAEDLTDGKIVAFKAVSVTNQEWVNWAGPSTIQPVEQGLFTVETIDGGLILKRNSDNMYIGRNGDVIEFVAKENATVFTVTCPPLDGVEVSGTHEVVLPEWAIDGNYQVRFTNNGSFLNVQASQTGVPKYAAGKGSWSIFMIYDAENYAPSETVSLTFKLFNQNNVNFNTQTVTAYVGEIITPPSVDFMKIARVECNGSEMVLDENQGFTVTADMSEITCVYSDDLKFQTTTIVDGQFAENTKWYQLSIHNTNNRAYFKYNSETQIIDPIKTEDLNFYDDTQLWCFVGSASEGVQVYNKAAGPNVCVTFNTDNVALAESSEKSVWSLVKTRSTTVGFEDAFCLTNSGTYINYNSSANKIAYWSDNDDGSAIIAYSFADYVTSTLETMQAYLTLPEGTVGTPKAGFAAVKDAINAFETNPNKDTEDAVYTALNTDPIEFSSNEYYRIMTKGRNDQHYLLADTILSGALLDNSNAAQIWKFVSNGDNYNLLSQGVYTMTPAQSVTVETSEDVNKAQAFIIDPRTDSYAQFALKPALDENAFELHLAAGLDIVGWNGGGASSWYLIPATNIDIVIPESGYTTINYPFAIQKPGQISAYTGSVDYEKGIIDLKELENDVVPANTPVVLSATAGTYTLTILADNTDESLVSDLKGVLLPVVVDDGTTAYMLSQTEIDNAGFYPVDTTDKGQIVGANSAYLTVDSSLDIKTFVLNFDDGTGINHNILEQSEEIYYDLQGRAVKKPSKGIYVTKSGKKVLFIK